MEDTSSEIIFNDWFFDIEESVYEVCQICCNKRFLQNVNTKTCKHMYCEDCLRFCIRDSLQKFQPAVSCPDQQCSGKISLKTFNYLFGFYVSRKQIRESEILFCKGCDLLILFDKKCITKVKCRRCFLEFCPITKCIWNKQEIVTVQDIELFQQMRKLNYMKCPCCLKWVEKFTGCDHITCQCSYQFCYKCGCPYAGHTTIKCADNKIFGYWLQQKN